MHWSERQPIRPKQSNFTGDYRPQAADNLSKKPRPVAGLPVSVFKGDLCAGDRGAHSNLGIFYSACTVYFHFLSRA
jgi:hypothetical protein